MTLTERLFNILFHAGILFTRNMTLGVRGVVRDEDGRIFLVRHTYIKGWHLPGGGVERGETLEMAIRKELREEGNIIVEGELQLFAVYKNEFASKRDHVAMYICRSWHQPHVPKPNREIAETGFFDLADLPEETTPATRRRLNELFGDEDISAYW